MQWSRFTLLPALLLALLLVACGGPAASTNGNGGNGGGESQAAEATDTPEPAQSQGNGGSGGNGGFDGDLEQLAEALTPPNSTETSRTEVSGVIFLTWDSTDSPEDLAAWYEDAIEGQNMNIFSRTSTQGFFSYIFGIEEGSSFGGVATMGPSSTGGSGSSVGLQIGESSGS
ncbi:MAG TPA: hypothetical protein VH859_07555 [Candidatus Limnocylindria bacterium]